jgi:hypothetical protein
MIVVFKAKALPFENIGPIAALRGRPSSDRGRRKMLAGV